MIYLISPHIDDALFSCSMLIRAIGRRTSSKIKVLNIFSTSSYCIDSCDKDRLRITQRRVQEERYAFSTMGHVKPVFFNFLDNYDRSKNTSNYLLKTSIAGRLRLIITKRDIVIAPLSVGDHPDHCLSLFAALKTVGVSKSNTIYYQDLPYSAKRGQASTRAKIDNITKYNNIAISHSVVIPGCIRKKISDCNKYRSQIDSKTLEYVQQQYKINGGEKIYFEKDFLRRKMNRKILYSISCRNSDLS